MAIFPAWGIGEVGSAPEEASLEILPISSTVQLSSALGPAGLLRDSDGGFHESGLFYFLGCFLQAGHPVAVYHLWDPTRKMVQNCSKVTSFTISAADHEPGFS